MNEDAKNLEKATFGAGCFWCVEAVFQQLKGVKQVTAGYAGGDLEYPTYRQVCSGNTGHAEVAQITFDTTIISYDQLLTVFWHSHNPTTPNRQGADIGTQYRSVIFYHNENQKKLAIASKDETDECELWENSIVTDIEPLENFYKAEADHQDYYENNPQAGYCSMVIAPKLKKLHDQFADLLKTSTVS